MTTTQNCCTISNNLILPTQPATSAQTGWNGAIVAINTLGISNAETSTDDSQALSLTALNLLSFSEEGSTAKNMSGTSTNSLPQNEMGTLLLPVNSTTESTGRASGSPYSLLLAQENNYFPVATANGALSSTVSTDITLPMPSPCDSSSAANAYQFLQNIMAYPSSPLAQQFTAALTADINANPVTGSCANVNAFFATTDSYQNVDFSIYSAVSGYVLGYAYAWANFQASFTYTIYSQTTTGSISSGSTSGSKVTLSPLGTIVFSQSANERPAVSDASGGYSMTWNPNEGSAVVLNFAAGQLVSNEGEDTGEICLQTAFLDAALLTGNPHDADKTSQALVGLINGIHVLGIPIEIDSIASQAPQMLGVSQASDDSNQEISSQDAKDAGMSIKDIVILATTITAVVGLLAWISYMCYRAANPPADEIAEAQNNLGEWFDDNLSRSGLTEDNYKGELSTIQEAQESQEASILEGEQVVLEGEEIQDQFKEEKDLLAYGNNSNLQEDLNQSNLAANDLKNVNYRSGDAPEQLNSIQEQITANQENINQAEAIAGTSSNENIYANNFQEAQTMEADVSNQEEKNNESENSSNAIDGDNSSDTLF